MAMKPQSRTLLLTLAAGGLAFAASFAARRASAPDNTPKSGPAAARQDGRRPDSAVPFARSWSAALATPDPVVRAERLLELLVSADATATRGLAMHYADDSELLRLILHRWAFLDLGGAARWVEQAERDGLTAAGNINTVVETWALHDPDGLKAWFKEPAHVWLQYRLMDKLTGALFARDPLAALALAKDFPDSWRLPPGAMTWVRKDPATAAQTLGQLPLGTQNAWLVDQAVGMWTEQNPAAAAAWAGELLNKRGSIGASAVTTVLQKWVEHDPAAAAAFLKTLPRGQGFGLGMAYQWAKQDPGAALAWISSNSDPSERGRMMSDVVRAAAKNDLPATAAFVARMPDDAMRDKAQAAVAAAWSEKDPAAAVAWSAQLPPGTARYSALINSVPAWAAKDAAAAATWAKAAPEGSLPAQIYGSIMDSLRSDRTAAYAWLNELPESAAYSAMGHFWGGYTGADVAGVLAFPDGKYKTAILERTVSRYFARDPDNAVAWASSLPAGADRDSVRRALESAPVVTAPEQGNSLTEARKQDLLKRLQ